MPHARILLVEDESIVAMDIQQRLEDMDYKVVGCVSTGNQVIPEIERTHPDLVLMDIMLKGKMDGIHVAQVIRRQFFLPVVYLTALADDKTLHRAEKTDPFGFILKPFNDTDLHATIELALYKFQADRMLRENEQWLTTTLRSMSDGVIATDAGGHIKLMNVVAEKLTGWTLSKAHGKNVNEVVKIVGPARQTIQWDMISGAPLSDEVLKQCRDSLLLLPKSDHAIATPVDVSVSPLHDARGQGMGIVLVVHDRTEQTRADAALEEERNLLRTLIDTFPDSIYIKDTSSHFIIGNQALAARMGAAHPGEIIGKTDFDYYPQAYAEKFQADEQRIIKTNQPLINQEEESIDVAGISRWLLTTKVPFCNRAGEVIGLVGTGRDITERKHQQAEQEAIEARIREYQKLESIGTLAAGIAHDFNNMLMGIQGNVELAQMNLNSVQSVGNSLKDIKTSCQQAADLVRQLLAYAGKGSYRMEPVNLSAMIRQMLPLIQPLVSKKAEVQLQLDDHIPLVNGDAMQIRQVIMNLIINASEALGDLPGFIRMETGRMTVDARYVASAYRQSPLPAGGYAYIQVSDSGCGMDARTQAQLFEPFFTTKFIGRGLGLPVILGIIRKHAGDIHVESAPGKGTSIKFLLPCCLDSSCTAGTVGI